ncbi:MAG: pantetheine-phosphate adenylyltransferase [Chloroflexi bacterium]|nr:pantetheine-phosphate adenylyltransferase [Chloroflexota bacterium]
MTVALYPGSFDPVTNGHLDVATRAARLFDRVVIGVFGKPAKHLLFTVEERVELWKGALGNLCNVSIEPYSMLTVEFARQIGAQVIVRGLRMSSDFEGEFEMALMNKQISPKMESVFLMANLPFQFLSSSLLKEIVQLGGDITSMVPPNVLAALESKFKVPLHKEQNLIRR